MDPITKTYQNPVVCGVEFVETSEVESIIPRTDNLEKDVTLKSGKSWKPVYLTPPIRQRSESATGAAGLAFKHSLESGFPGEDISQVRNLHDLENRKLVLRLTFTDATQRLMGELENPVRISRKREDGSQVVFSCETEYPLLFISN